MRLKTKNNKENWKFNLNRNKIKLKTYKNSFQIF